MDQVKNIYRRETYSLPDLLAQVGGLAKTLSFMLGSLALYFSRNTFMLQLVH